MKIRTITTGVELSSMDDLQPVTKAAEFNNKAKERLEKFHCEVQTTRVTTNPWREYLKGDRQAVLDGFKKLDQRCVELKIDFFSIGYADDPDSIKLLPDVIQNTSKLSCSAKVGDKEGGINHQVIKEAAKTLLAISKTTENGMGNFLYTAQCNCPPGIPFFPASFHRGEPAFGIGLECGDLAYKAFKDADGIDDAKKRLQDVFIEEVMPLANTCHQIADEFGFIFNGIDVSLNPSLEKEGSVAWAFEQIGPGKFGDQGTLAISAMVTETLKSLPFKLCGYSGLMLPVCEDLGLCEAANEGRINISKLLLFSSVCGCGLDTVPIPGDTPQTDVENIILDMASEAVKLNKPLSARLLPRPGRAAGENTDFNFIYLSECKILDTR